MVTTDIGVRIAVMGATGSGKSTFINEASGSDLPVGRGLESCTSDVQTSQPFVVSGRVVTLIDTPGFDDTTRSDTDILAMIAAYLSKTYEDGAKLAGVVYMQRISDFRMGGTSQRNFRIFRELCGESSLKNVLLVTNMWSEANREIEEAREVELATKDQFFKPVLDQGARLLRHVGTLESVHTILHHLIDSDPAALRIQQEIVDEHKPIEQTAAGSELRHSLDEQADRHREDMRTLQADMEAAMRTRDENNRVELQKALEKKQQDYLRIMEQTSERIAAEFVAERVRLEGRIQRMEDEHHKQLQTMAGLQGEVARVLQEKKQKEALKQSEILVAKQTDDDRRAQKPGEGRNARASGEESHQKHSLRNILEELEKVRTELRRERERLAALERPLVDRLLAKVPES